MTVDHTLRFLGKGTVKVYFGKNDDRNLMIGKFVELEDHKDLIRKGLIRFVNKGSYDLFRDAKPSGRAYFTRIYACTNFSLITIVENEQKESYSQ